ncbi:MAG TPA: hypothetical protein PKC30_02985 [Saprospiraceae bacterium]|nr:hypothetical protein [Saprospiraceae bacterium]
MFRSRRSKILRDKAAMMDMGFSEKDDFGLIRMMTDFQLFKVGMRKRISNIFTQKNLMEGFELKIFDYQYTISTGKSSVTYNQSVLFIHSIQLSLPKFWMQPQNFMHRLGQWIGIDDVDFADFPEFSKNYWLKGTDVDLVRKGFNPKVLQFFSNKKGWRLEGIHYYLILYKRRKLLKPEEIETLYDTGIEVFELFKENGRG